MNKGIQWDNAKWIGSPEISLDAARQGVYGIEARFSGSGGIVFGANDERLKVVWRNLQNQAGENYISYKVDLSSLPAKLIIKRSGYSKEDSVDNNFAVIEIDKSIINNENKGYYHTLTIKVDGNKALAYLNGQLIDGEYVSPPFPGAPSILTGRQLNPLGNNDVITFPRLNHIGLISGANYENLRIFDLRFPESELYSVNSHKCSQLIDKLVNPSHGGVSVLKCDFNISKEVKEANLYATARGTYIGKVNGIGINVDGSINGQRSKDYFTPGASQFDKHLFYHAYEISSLLNNNYNTLEFTLGSGWWSDAQGFIVRDYNFWGNNTALKAILEISYTDGTTEIMVTDLENWKVTNDGPIRYASHFHGETYDARKVLDNWKTPIVVDTVGIPSPGGFISHPHLNFTEPKIIEHIGNPVGEVKVLKAQSVTKIEDVFIYDMGQNMVGVPRVKLKGENGQIITLRFGEYLYPKMEEYGYLQGMIMTENLRDADCTDIYICKGDLQGEVIFPQLTFHGYRYLEISGIDKELPLEDVEGVVLSSIIEETGSFECSNPMVNRLFENILWSQRGNFLSIPTDCPQRNERVGWLGDAHVFAGTAVYNANVLEFLERFLISVRDLQREDGKFPNVAPIDVGFGGILWESAGVIIPWELYHQYGNKGVLVDNFDSMLKYINYLQENSTDYKVNSGVGLLGDWLSIDTSTDNNLLWNAMFAYNMRIMADTAKILEQEDLSKELYEWYISIKSTWNKTYVDPKTGKTLDSEGNINHTQCSYALPLYHGIFEDGERAAKLLNEKTVELEYTLTTGFIGTQCILAALSDYGYVDTAYRLLQQKQYPSWLYSVEQGATTIWERWNSYTLEKGFGGHTSMNSFNHYSLGAVGAWFYSRILGIRPGEAGGYKQFILQPCFGGFDWAKGYYDTDYGRISCSWTKIENGYKWIIEIPEGTSADVILPSRKKFNIDGGHYEYVIEI